MTAGPATTTRPQPQAETVAARRGLLRVWGPGLIVMLADTDAGCLVTAAQSGASWGYALLLPQLLLIPILFMVQEITVRLGIVTGKGHGLLIREHFGRGWGYQSAGTLLLSSIGALLTEFAGIAGVGELFGVSRWVTIPVATLLLLAVACTGRYRRAERIGILVGLGELTFIIAMVLAGPHPGEVVAGALAVPLNQPGYVYLLAANIGAVIMPWMIFYQQTAVVDKGLTVAALPKERRDTAFGAVLTQVIMIAVIVTLAATVYTHGLRPTLNTVGEIAAAVAPFLGTWPAKILIGVAVLGGGLVAALVVSLAGSWGLADVMGWKHSLNSRVDASSWKFYTVYALAHVLGAVIVLSAVDLVALAVDVEVMNALLLPIVLGFLLALEAKSLPKEHRMRGAYRWIVWTLCGIVMAFGLYMVPVSLLPH